MPWRKSSSVARLVPSYILNAAYFVFGGFAVPLLIEAVRWAVNRPRLRAFHVLTLLTVLYLLANLWMVAPLFRASCSIGLVDFGRWRLRELAPFVAVFLTAWSKREGSVQQVATPLLKVGAAFALLGGLEYVVMRLGGPSLFGFVKLDPSGHYFYTAWLSAHNAAGGLYACLAALALAYALRGQVGRWVVLGNVLGLSMTGSRSALVGFSVVFAVMLAWTLRRALFNSNLTIWSVILAIFLLSALVILTGPSAQRFQRVGSPSDTTGNSRFALWAQAFDAFRESPLVGVGWGNYGCFSGAHTASGISTHAHNSYLQVLAETGILGFALYAGWLLLLVRELWYRREWPLLTSLGSLAISSLFEHNFGSPTVTVPLFLLLGTALASPPPTGGAHPPDTGSANR